jgi:hypothetical protein
MKLKQLAATAAALVLGAGMASAQTWAPLTNQPGHNLGAMLQLRDGRILVHEEQSGNSRNWWILTPDSTGSYLHGTWSSGGQLPSGYAPWFFGSQVLLDGQHVVVEGGEYNNGNSVWTTLGAMYDVPSNTWVSNSPPSGWANIGDAQSVILADGRYVQASCCGPAKGSAFFTGPNTWSANGNILGFSNDEGGYTLLPNSKVIMVDAWNNTACGSNMQSEIFDPTTNTWSCGSTTPTQMWDNSGHELGPAIVMYNGKMLQVGAVPATAVYDPASNTWAAGPTPSGGLDAADGPAALEPNGKVLLMLSPGEFQAGCQMVEYNPSNNTLANTANPQNCPSDSSFEGHLMILPTGQIMFTDFSGRVELYTPAPPPTAANHGPIQVSQGPVQSFTADGTNNLVNGLHLNGYTENNGYGDDYQGATNYPLVRLTSVSTGQVYWATTHDDSSHSIDPNAGAMTTLFDLPAGMPRGGNIFYQVVVIANGIASNTVVYH